MEEARHGYLLEPWLYEHLESYERASLSFAEWFEETMAAATTEGILEHLARLGVVAREAK